MSTSRKWRKVMGSYASSSPVRPEFPYPDFPFAELAAAIVEGMKSGKLDAEQVNKLLEARPWETPGLPADEVIALLGV